MTKTIRILTLLALMVIGAGQAWAKTEPDLGKIVYTQTVNDHGTLSFYADETCQTAISNPGNGLNSSGLTPVEDGSNVIGYKVYIKATPDLEYTLGAADEGGKVTFIKAEVTVETNVAGARTRGTAPTVGVGDFLDVTATTTTGVYCMTMPADKNLNLLVSATFVEKPMNTAAISYIDADGESKSKDAETVYILDGTETTLGRSGSDPANNNKPYETWYVCNTAVDTEHPYGLAYDHGLALYGNVHLILADGCKMTVTNSSGNAINSINEIAIHGQSTGNNAGSLIAEGSQYGIYTSSNIAISGGQVTATGTNHSGICSGAGKISITDCNVTATGGSYGIYASGIITISGEKVEAIATGTNGNGINTGASKITITDGEVIATGGSNGIKGGAEIIINKGKVTANGTSGSGIESGSASNISITDCEVNAEGGNNGIKSGSYGVTINGGKVTATGTNGSGIESVGPSNISITNCEVNAEGGSNGIKGYANITINGGKVTATGTSGSGIESGDASNISITNCEVNAEGGSNGIKSGSYGVTINGGKVTATGTNGSGIESVGPSNISITDCEVNAEGGSNGIKGSNGVTISGGQVVANYTGSNGYGIYSGINGITLGWTNATDYICANSYATNYNGPVKTTDGQRFVAYNMANESDISATAIVSGSSTDATPTFTLAGINGKTLKPLGGYIVTVADGISLMDGTTDKAADFTITTGEGTEAVTTPYYIYKASTEEAPVSVTLSYGGSNFIMLNGVPEGTTLNAFENQPMQRSFAMPAADVALTATAVTSFSVSGYYTYSGSAQTPSIKYGDNVIMNADDDFIVTGITKGGTTVTDAIDAGDYSLTIAGVGSYLGTASGIAFSINKKPVYGSSNILVGDAIYNGGIVIPEIELKDDNNNVIASSEYTVNIVSYEVFNHGIDYGNGNSLSSVMDVGIYYAVLYGKAESNYDIQTSTAFTVSPKPVGISWSTDALVYDGTDKAPAASATGVEDVDAGKVSVTVSVDGEHSDAGNYTATASALSGNRASNYRLPTSSETGYATLTNAFAISPKPVTVISTGVTADNKIYDGTTSATLSGSFAFDDGMIIDDDDVTITSGTGAFADKNVGIGKAVVISGVTLGGMNAGNYTLSAQPTGITGSITKKTVTVSGITASNKAYDGKTMATLNYNSTTISGKVTGDKLSVSATGAFADKNAGNNKTVNISNITLTGSDKGNYTLATTGATTTANISKKALTVTADDKSVSYGDAAPTYTASYSGFVNNETSSVLSGTLSFACDYTSGSNTGTYTITPSGLTSSNYSITFKEGTLTVEASIVESESGTTVTLDENGYSVTIDEGYSSAGIITLPGGAPSITAASLTYNRTLSAPGSGEGDVTIGGQAAKLYTTCLPTAPSANANVKYYTLASVSGSTLHFTEISGDPQADTPYLVAVTGNSNVTEHVTGNNVTLKKIVTGSSTSDGSYTMMGTQTGLTNSEASSAAGIADNATYILQPQSKWGKVTNKAGVYIPPFRAFIVGPAVNTGNAARQLNSSFDDDDATGIDSIRTIDGDGTERWYDLNGRSIDKPTRKGIYIRNGKMTTTNFTN